MEFDKTDIIYRKLDEQDAVKLFDCGDDDLNDLIINDAPLYYKSRISTSYILENAKTGDVIGYFSA